jgi:hypothetical protein
VTQPSASVPGFDVTAARPRSRAGIASVAAFRDP